MIFDFPSGHHFPEVGPVMRTILPFYSALGMTLMAVTYVPAFSLWLPNLLK
jgi:TRAP-type C4-dicarboxylate transport system permease large subunit